MVSLEVTISALYPFPLSVLELESLTSLLVPNSLGKPEPPKA